MSRSVGVPGISQIVNGLGTQAKWNVQNLKNDGCKLAFQKDLTNVMNEYRETKSNLNTVNDKWVHITSSLRSSAERTLHSKRKLLTPTRKSALNNYQLSKFAYFKSR